MPSNSAFTSHWRLHHKSICSLCVNIYRARYDVKENDIHDVMCKSQNSSSTSLDIENDNILGSFKTETLPNGLIPDDLVALGIPELNEPPLKRPRLDSPSQTGLSSSTAILYKRESIKFLPRLVEVVVAPMPPNIGQHFSSRKGEEERPREEMGKT